MYNTDRMNNNRKGAYTLGPEFDVEQDITKKDIINMCKILNEHLIFKDKGTFKPESIGGGGLLFEPKKFYSLQTKLI